jgi:hypothetical protein
MLWVNAAATARFAQPYQELARKLQGHRHDNPHVDECKLVYHWLEEVENEGWLMVLDNVDDGDVLHGQERNERLAKAMIDYFPLTI